MSRCSLNPCRSIAPSRKRSTVSLLLISLLFVCGTNPLVSAQETKSAAPHSDVLNAAMQKFVQQGDSSGIVTLVGHKGSIVHLGAVGVADIASGKPMQTDSAFAIASMTKPVVGTALMILQDEGKLSVDDEVAKYIPGFADVKLRNGDAVSRAITIRDCVTHSAGTCWPTDFQGFPEGCCRKSCDPTSGVSTGNAMAVQPRHERRRADHRNRVEAAPGQVYPDEDFRSAENEEHVVLS